MVLVVLDMMTVITTRILYMGAAHLLIFNRWNHRNNPETTWSWTCELETLIEKAWSRTYSKGYLHRATPLRFGLKHR